MRNPVKLILTLAVGMTAFALLSAAGSANRLSVNEQRFDMIWTGLNIRAGGANITCPVTLQGRLTEATFIKRNTENIGSMTGSRITTASCMGGTYAFEGLPWRIQYNGFTGTLPNISTIDYRLVEAVVRINEINGCQYKTLETAGLQLILTGEASHVITQVRPNRGNRIAGLGGCSLFTMEWEENSGSLSKLERATEVVRITLI